MLSFSKLAILVVFSSVFATALSAEFFNEASSAPVFWIDSSNNTEIRVFGELWDGRVNHIVQWQWASPPGQNTYTLTDIEWDDVANGTGIGAVQWFEPGTDELNIRVYWCDTSGHMVGKMWTGADPKDWIDDKTFGNKKFDCTDRTSLAAVQWIDSKKANHIRIYAQSLGPHVQEILYDDATGWSYGTDLGAANVHSHIAAVVVGDDVVTPLTINVFYQIDDVKSVIGIQNVWQANVGWQTSKFKWGSDPEVPDKASLAAVGFLTPAGDPEIRLFFGTSSATFLMYTFTKGNWDATPAVAVKGEMHSTKDPLSVLGMPVGSDYEVRLYFQDAEHCQEYLGHSCNSTNCAQWALGQQLPN
ncbi:hypothetical protein C8J56DRAFT_1037456 [Mycena floridula]|nr:hypothetical protein C8J56DRAFT_1037456 [Mycena floridula]